MKLAVFTNWDMYRLCLLRHFKKIVSSGFSKDRNSEKAAGPQSVSPSTLEHCAEQMSPVFTFLTPHWRPCHVTACFKTIIPVPKTTRTAWLNDYIPVTLTSVVIKSFEQLVLSHLKTIKGPLMDPLQFTYRANRSVDDAVEMALHFILQHLVQDPLCGFQLCLQHHHLAFALPATQAWNYAGETPSWTPGPSALVPLKVASIPLY